MKKKKVIWGIVAAALVFVICAAAISSLSKNRRQKPKASEPVREETAASSSASAPVSTTKSTLTNEALDEAAASQRVAAIMTEDTKKCLPQYGINYAGVIYECPMEGGMSRIMALYDYQYYKDLDRIGNVRSCRPYFAFIAREYDAIYVHFGQSVHGGELLDTGIVDHLSGLDGSLNKSFYRVSDRKAPHNAYTSGGGIENGIAKKGFRTDYDASYKGHFTFAEADAPETLESGSDCAVLKEYYPNNRPYFVYDPNTQTYSRHEFGIDVKDAVNDQPYTCTNIILQNVPWALYEDNITLNLNLLGSGSGKYLTHGKMIDITWKKDSYEEQTRYYDASGQEIRLNTGKTWISLVQNSSAGSNQYFASYEEFAQ